MNLGKLSGDFCIVCGRSHFPRCERPPASTAAIYIDYTSIDEMQKHELVDALRLFCDEATEETLRRWIRELAAELSAANNAS